MSLRNQILEAKSEEEVKELLEKGKTFKYASEKTRRKWDKAAKSTIKVLRKEK